MTGPADIRRPSNRQIPPATAADRLLRALADHGIELFLANPGTDFPSIVEGFAQAAEIGTPVPRPLLVPHENAAVAMAHGFYLATGRVQAVMVHTNVGTANALNALINASRDRVPLLLLAGRSPVLESGAVGARTRNIHWAQEMFDQAGMLRELVKWDYELRCPDQVEDVVARAVEIATTAPGGPVYLTLPREVLAAAGRPGTAAIRRAVPEPSGGAPAAVGRLADWIAAAERPVVITSAIGRRPVEADLLARLAADFALPVVCVNPQALALPSDHPMHHGYQPGPLLATADLVVVLESDVPWVPALAAPAPDCRVVHIGQEPGFGRYPIRSFPVDLAIAADPESLLRDLAAGLSCRGVDRAPAVVERRRRLAAGAAALRAGWLAASRRDGEAQAMTPAWISRCIGEALADGDILFNEYPLRLEHCARRRPGSYFGLGSAGGLGWSLGAALGAKLAEPDRLVAAVMGDGAYIFANPTACHWIAAAYGLPILAVVMNNQGYAAVRNTTLAMYRDGAAARAGGRMFASLAPAPAYEMLVAASGGLGLRVDEAARLPAALAEAVAAVRGGRQAVLNVICRD